MSDPVVAEMTRALEVTGVELPLSRWPGNCYAVSVALADHYGGRAEYGVYWGHVSPRSMFSGHPQRHGWIRMPDGSVTDPTRWVFEFAPDALERAYIWHGPDDDYDLGAQRLRLLYRSDCPAADPTRPLDVRFDFPEAVVVEALIGLPPYDQPRIFWLANAPLKSLGDDARAIYAALDRAGLSAFVPIDLWRAVMGGN